MIDVIQYDNEYRITFPYKFEIKEIVKAIPGRSWNPEGKYWSIPLNHLGMLINQFKGTEYESMIRIRSKEHINENSTLGSTKSIPEIDISKVKLYSKPGTQLYAHQIDFLKFAIDREHHHNMNGFLCCDEMGLGKAVKLDTKVYTPDGYKLMRDIKVGDKVFSQDGEIVEVLRTYDHDNLDMYEITFCDGKSITCCKDHLWVIMNSENKQSVASTSQIIDGSFRYQKNRKGYDMSNYCIPRCNPVRFNAQEVPLDPWLLGFLIGDGHFSKDGVSITTSYPTLLDAVKMHLPDGHELHQSQDSIDYNITKGPYVIRCNETGKLFSTKEFEQTYHCQASNILQYHKGYLRSQNLHFERIGNLNNEVVKSLKSLNLLNCTAKMKFVPEVYKYNDMQTRLSILQGLMDSDGYATESSSNTHIFTTTSKKLAEDVIWLCESLGYITSYHEYEAKYYDKCCGLAYDITIRCDNPEDLYKYSIKKQRANIRKFRPRRSFKSIKYVGKMPGKCITVSGNSHTYLIDHFIVTHNTVESINLALYNKTQYKFKHCLILCCVNMSKYNWQQEIADHTNGQFEGYILGSRKLKSGKINYNGSSKDKLEDLKLGHKYGDKKESRLPYFIIMNIEAIRMKDSRLHPISDILIDYINSGKLDMIIIDEVHKNVSPTSQQGKQLLRIKKSTGKKCLWLPMTGTPIVNQPTDLFLPLRLVEGHSINSFYSWNQNFCVFGGFGGHEIVGYKNMDKLKDILQVNMIRRTKDEVLDLPEKIEIIEYVENTRYQNKLMKSVEADIMNERESIITSLNPLAKMLRLRQVNGSPELVDNSLQIDKNYVKKNAKLARLLELIQDIISRDEKVVVFSNWVEPLRMIYRHLASNYKVASFTGTMNERDRQSNKEAFLSDPNCKIILGTIGALGTTHTLTSANNIIFYDEPWQAADRSQACDRIHRLGASKSCRIYTLISKDTIDERVHNILYRKDTISKYIVDDKLDIYNNPELFNLLLGK